MKRLFFLSLAIVAIGFTGCSKSKKLAKQHDHLLDTYKTLQKELPEAKVSMNEDKVKVVLPEAVMFGLNQSDILPAYLPVMKRISGILNKYPKTNILITGYTDITGTVAYNNSLSIKRANTTKDILV